MFTSGVLVAIQRVEVRSLSLSLSFTLSLSLSLCCLEDEGCFTSCELIHHDDAWEREVWRGGATLRTKAVKESLEAVSPEEGYNIIYGRVSTLSLSLGVSCFYV